MAFKDSLKKIRKDVGLTQRELAKRSGISYSYLTKLESGEQKNPTYETLGALGNVLGAPLGAVYDFTGLTESTITCIGRAYLKATPEVQRIVAVALKPFMEDNSDIITPGEV